MFKDFQILKLLTLPTNTIKHSPLIRGKKKFQQTKQLTRMNTGDRKIDRKIYVLA